MVGMKSRGVYETPGGTLLYAAHSELEQLVLDRRTLAAKDLIAPRYADLVYEGRWWTTEREAYDAFVNVTQERVTGSVTLRLYKGSIAVVGRESEHALYDERFVTFGEDDVYQQSDAAGFIRLFALPARVRALKDQEMGRAPVPASAARRQRRSERRTSRRCRSRDDDSRPGTTPAQTSHKLWGGRFAGGPAPAFDALNNSIGIDFRLWPFDIQLSKAWAMALYSAGVLTLDECTTIERGLDAVAARLAGGEQPIATRRRRAHADRSPAARRDRRRRVEAAHRPQPQRSGRDRDASLVDGRVRRASTRAVRAPAAGDGRSGARSRDGAHAVVHAHAARAFPCPARTGCSRTSGRSSATARASRAAQRSAGVLPLGSGAVAGCAYPISRVLLQGSLGFDAHLAELDRRRERSRLRRRVAVHARR